METNKGNDSETSSSIDYDFEHALVAREEAEQIRREEALIEEAAQHEVYLEHVKRQAELKRVYDEEAKLHEVEEEDEEIEYEDYPPEEEEEGRQENASRPLRKQTKTRHQMALKEAKRLPKLLKFLTTKNKETRLPFRNLATLPRNFITAPSIIPHDVPTLKLAYDETRKQLKYGERYTSLILVLIKFIDNYTDDSLKVAFELLVAESANKDAVALLAHIKTQNTSSFGISRIPHATYSKLERFSLVTFNILRLAAARKDLLDLFITTFDSLCKHRTITTGWSTCEPGLEASVLQTMEEVNDGTSWDQDYIPAPKPADISTLSDPSNDDTKFTENVITESGTNLLYEYFVVRKQENGPWTSNVLAYMDEAKFDDLRMKAGRDGNVFTCHFFPCFRSLCVSFGGNVPVLLSAAAEQGGCRLMKNSTHHCITVNKDKKHSGVNVRKLAAIITPEKATFATSAQVSFEFDTTLNYFQGTEKPLKQEVLFEVLDRKSHHYKYLKSTAVQVIPRKNSSQVYLNQSSISPALLIQSGGDMANMLLDDFVKNDSFLNVDAALALYNLKKDDYYNVKFNWRCIEGSKDFVTAYLIASTLVSTTDLVFREEIKKLVSRAHHHADAAAQLVLDECYPQFV